MLVCVMVVVEGIFVVVVCSAGWVEWDLNAFKAATIGLSNSEVSRARARVMSHPSSEFRVPSSVFRV